MAHVFVLSYNDNCAIVNVLLGKFSSVHRAVFVNAVDDCHQSQALVKAVSRSHGLSSINAYHSVTASMIFAIQVSK